MKKHREYILFCDESDKKGEFFSNFYGGVIVGSGDYQSIVSGLSDRADAAGLHSEIKWSKVGPLEVERYQILLTSFFDAMQSGILRMRIMFRQNSHVPENLSPEHRKNEYFLLYYQFLKHGFGIRHMPDHSPEGVDFRLYLDKLPNQNRESKEQFRGYIAALADNARVKARGFRLSPENITDVDSKNHILLQCMDVVLGSIAFRLNDKHKQKAEGSFRRGKRTIAKEKLYDFIRSEIVRVTGKQHFNIGASTSPSKYPEGRWSDPYLHWKFVPRDRRIDPTLTKSHKRKGPVRPSSL